ncbi:hypothetical protein [Bowmanella yangjiangensis]|uniref:Preprotein translocase subunit SecE n=1 Tax=Bowmanella yangjiangensis TaxID=2811230 RepID=A0ABS3CQ48_9ALTE|nr:hypothetical protein [Bowmanella yangjiangensis]MBN7819212.1 hypothetical protein [Bowmanella yangjiangensis]
MEIWIFLAAVVCMLGFCWYVSPYRRREVTKAQHVVATTWLLFRRAVCLLGAILCLFAIGIFLLLDTAWKEKVFPIGLFSLLLIMCVYVGMFGQGWVQYSLSDDFMLYKKLKEKYKWRF